MSLNTILIADGSSDQAIKPILEWLLAQHLPEGESFEVTVADLRRLPNPPRDVINRLRQSRQLFAGDVLFIHHDAEREPLPVRRQQIDDEVRAAFPNPPAYVRVVPVRMMEAWLLSDEDSIREAAGNPNGTMSLELPPIKRAEHLPDPKATLIAALEKATGNSARRRSSFNPRQAIHRLAEFNQEKGFGALRGLPSFDALEEDIVQLIRSRDL